ncbi:hypothetical protein PIB30_061032 [Stylosanthes scabra]|uniref:Uncharacterized protein n=1 Tax=Stylosanthes scabra TaxID=79078 RepID=A0ABU6ZJE7_9FABA|nr:hypothetical protein [Stylosanthes scabra]
MEENRQTDENGKPVVWVPIDDPYAWVKGEVRDIVSWFSDEECVAELGDPSAWVREGENVVVEFLPCSAEDRVFHKAEGSLFTLYKSSYKDFKSMFVKVRSPILGMEEVNDECLMVADFLEQNLSAKGLLSLNKLLQWEKEKESVCEYLDTTTGGLKNFFKLKTERELSSNAMKTKKGVVVNQPSEKKKPISVKRRRAKGEASGKSKVIELTSSRCCRKEVSLDEVKTFTENQRKLHGYMGADDLSSVWSEHYPMTVVAEEHFQSKADMDLLKSVGDIGRAQFMQVCATRMLCVGHYEELRAKRDAEQKKAESVELEKSMEREKKL